MFCKDAKKARSNFANIHPSGPDGEEAPEFYKQILTEFGFKTTKKNKKIAFIVVAHSVNSLPYFLEGLSGLGVIVALLTKGSGTVASVAKTLADQYQKILCRDINKNILRDKPEKARDFLQNIIRIPEWEEYKFLIIDHGGYFAPSINDILPHFRDRLLGIVEHTLNGEIRYKENKKQDRDYCVPVCSIARTELKAHEDRFVAESIRVALSAKVLGGEGISQTLSTLEAIVIIGYGHMGSQVALSLKQVLDEKIIHICDCSEEARKNARLDFSNVVEDTKDLLSTADLIITATSSPVLNRCDFSTLKSRACVVFVTSMDDQITKNALKDYQQVNDNECATQYKHKNKPDHVIFLAANGGSANFLIGSTPHPVLHAILASVCVAALRLISDDFQDKRNAIIPASETDNKEILKIYEQHYPPIESDRFIKLHSQGWQLPKDNEGRFVGRQKNLKDLHARLMKGSSAAITQQQTLTGFGGVGKTELAINYLHRYRKSYWAVIWLQAEKNLTTAFYELAKELRIPLESQSIKVDSIPKVVNNMLGIEKMRPLENIVEDVYKKLATMPGRVLMIFDNAESKEAIRVFFPPNLAVCDSSKLKLLFTSRERKAWGYGCELDIDVFTPKEARQYIKKYLSEVSDDDVNALAKRLGRLPLALAVAVAYIFTDVTSSVESYLSDFNKRKKEFLDESPETTGSPYRATVLTTLNITFERLQKKSSEAVNLLEYCAYLDASFIPTFIFTPICKNANTVIKLLHQYSLVTFAENRQGFSVHPLIQEIIRIKQYDQGFVQRWVNYLVESLLNRQIDVEASLINKGLNLLVPAYQFDIEKPETLQRCIKLLPHVESVLEYARMHDIRNDQVEQLRLTSGIYYTSVQKDGMKAIDYLMPSPVYLTKKECGMWFNALGSAYLLKCQFSLAQEHCNRALKYCSENDIERTEILMILGDVMYSQGDLEAAYNYYKEAESIIGKLSLLGGQYPIHMSQIAYNLGNIYSNIFFSCYSSEKAEDCYRLSLELQAGEADFSIEKSTILVSLGRVLCESYRYEEAASCLQESLRICEVLFGEQPVSLKASILGHFGNINFRQKQLEQAKQYYKHALQIQKQTKDEFGKADLYLCLSYVVRDSKSRKKYCERALAIYKKAEHHEEIASVEGVLMSMAIMEKGEDIREKMPSLSMDDNTAENSLKQCYVARNYLHLAETWLGIKGYEKAFYHFQKAFGIFKRHLNVHMLSGHCLCRIAHVMKKIARKDQARLQEYIASVEKIDLFMEEMREKNIAMYFYLKIQSGEVLCRFNRAEEDKHSFYAIESDKNHLTMASAKSSAILLINNIKFFGFLNVESRTELIQKHLDILKKSCDTSTTWIMKQLITVADRFQFEKRYFAVISICENLLNWTNEDKSFLVERAVLHKKLGESHFLIDPNNIVVERHCLFSLKDYCELKEKAVEYLELNLTLANYYMHNEKYTKATEYYQLALDAYRALPVCDGADAVKINFLELRRSMGLTMVINADSKYILPINNAFSVHISYDPNFQRLFLLSPLMDNFPRNERERFDFYRWILTATVPGEQSGVGIRVEKDLMLMYRTILMKKRNCLKLRSVLPEFIETVKKWRDFSQKQFWKHDVISFRQLVKENKSYYLSEAAIIDGLNKSEWIEVGYAIEFADWLGPRKMVLKSEVEKRLLEEFGQHFDLKWFFDTHCNGYKFKIDDTFSLYFSLEIPLNSDRGKLVASAPLTQGLPQDFQTRFALYETLLENAIMDENMVGGRIGLDESGELIVMHIAFELEEIEANFLKEIMPLFLQCVKKLRATCANFLIPPEETEQTANSPTSDNPNSFFKPFLKRYELESKLYKTMRHT